ncbi:MAG: chromate transporter [Anaerolineales bacterium]
MSSVLPGSDALQLAMYIGYAVAGIPADLSRCSRPFCRRRIIILGVTMVLHRLRREAWLSSFIDGLTPAISVLMLFRGVENF